MKRIFRTALTTLAALALFASAACAETISFSGTVAVKDTYEVYAPIGGTVDTVEVEAGQAVSADDVIATLKTTKVYASQAGTVTGVFGQPGDSAETIASRYGAVMYLEGESQYTIAASTANAYNATANKYVHVGESVYLASRSDTSHTGEGIITAVSGTSYTVEVTSGTFTSGESCDIYRLASHAASSRIGRGSTSRIDPVAVTGTGSIVSFAVADGDQVTRGQLLFETLEGDFDGLYMSGTALYAGADGVVGQVNITKGSTLQKSSVAAVIYPAGAMQIEAQVNEADLSYIHVGDQVDIELTWNPDAAEPLTGTVAMISAVASSGEDGVTYDVTIDFTPEDTTRFGMSAVISTREVESLADETTEPAE